LKRIILLGATGSIGTSACDVVRTHPDEFKVVALAVRNNLAAAELIGKEFGAKVYSGEDGALRAVEENEADVVLVATVGLSGLKPTLAAIRKGMDVALATKEVLVAAGEFVTREAAAAKVRLLPVDSEHSAIFQCLQGIDVQREVARLVLTASGGPFLDAPANLDDVTPEQALRHPRWDMGRKVTVDSSTMMNKGFEIIEARWLFDFPMNRIDVVVHPESIVHSLVEFTDGATLAQLSPPDMRVPIQYALTWPRRMLSERAKLDLAALASLTFRAPDESRFPALRLVRDAERAGGTRTAVLSAADEIAVSRFLDGDIRYTDIVKLVADTVERAPEIPCDSIEAVFEADRIARELAGAWQARR
jgi:1-deoxy-D-xylulose-5-phosphate reductoisomerase